MPKTFWVYILASWSRRLYTGVTSDLLRRLVEHRDHVLPDSFTARYRITRLVYFETTENAWAAIAREKEIKRWRRARRVALIESVNRDWRDLALDLLPRDARQAPRSALRASLGEAAQENELSPRGSGEAATEGPASPFATPASRVAAQARLPRGDS